MRRQLIESGRANLYGALDDEETIFSRANVEESDFTMTILSNGVDGDRVALEPNKKLKYPKSVFFIVSNEFCERFSYYGMRTVLSLYLRYALQYDESSSTIIYHIFVMLCYFTPLFGGIMADAWLGKFKTILYVSIVYAIGNIVLSIGSVEALAIPHRELSLIGLVLIALGTGGIKPCVSSFGGDQFVLPEQEKQLANFFSVFYFSINAGSVISSFVTPKLKELHCLGSDDDCYPLAFGLPAVLMIVATLFFVCGSSMYKRTPLKGNIAGDIAGCISHAVARKCGGKEKREHWLDYADDKYSKELISDCKTLMKLIVLFSPTIVFWALFEQQGSKWTFQATRMNGDLGWYVVEPDQMQTLNAVLVLIFIPLFQYIIYPVLAKLRLVRSPLQKLCVGGFLAAIAFVVSGLLEIKIKGDLPSLPGSGEAYVQVYNSFKCDAQISGGFEANLTSYDYIYFHMPKVDNVTAKISGSCFDEWNGKISVIDGQVSSYMILPKRDERSVDLFALNLQSKNELEKPDSVNPKIKVVYSGSNEIKVQLKKDSNEEFNITSHQSAQKTLNGFGDFSLTVNDKSMGTITVAQGGVYTLMLTSEGSNIKYKLFTITSPNTVNIMWQIPQYIVITSAEIMFSITGLDFSYSQSPESLKSVLSSLWLLTDALGNVIILIIESANIENKMLEFFIYAAVMAVAMLVFTVLAIRYKYRTTDAKLENKDIQLEEQTKI